MGARKSWLDALKETIEEAPRTPSEDLAKPTPIKVQKVRKLQEAEREAGGEVVNLNAARALRDEDERRLLAAGWSPKDRCGPLALTIWANPETGFYCSQEIALHRLRDQAAASRRGV